MGRKIIREKIDYKWIITIACFLMIFTCLGFCSSNKGLYLAAITKALGIKRSLFSINDSCRYVTSAVINLFFGSLVTRFGARKMIGAGFAALIISILIYAYASSIFVFYIGGCFLGLGLAWTTTTMVGYAIRQWHTRNRGTIMGFVLAANGLGGAVAAQIVTPIIYNKEDPFGYRSAYRLVAVILLVIGSLVLLLFRDHSKKNSEENGKTTSRKDAWEGIDFQQAVRTPYFYAAVISVFLTGLTIQGVNSVASAHMNDVGMEAGYIAAVLSFHSLALTGFKFLAGISYDKLGLRITRLICDMTGVVTTLILAFVVPTPAGKVLAMIYGVFSSMAMPTTTVMLPLITTELFGEKSFVRMLGIFVSVNTAGYAVGIPLANLIYDIYGTYKPILYVLAAVMLLVTIIFQVALSISYRLAQKESYFDESKMQKLSPNIKA